MGRYKKPLLIIAFTMLPTLVVTLIVLKSMFEQPPEQEDDPIDEVATVETPQPPPPPPVQIAVARRAIPAGTVLKGRDVTTAELRPGESSEGAIVIPPEGDTDWIPGHVITESIDPGAPFVLDSMHAQDQAGFLAAAMSPGYRATSINVGSATGTAGIVTPGDYVDVILTANRTDTEDDLTQTRTIVRNRRVMAVDQRQIGEQDETDTIITATLETTQIESEQIVLASSLGELSLAVRDPDIPVEQGDPSESMTTEPITIEALLGPAPKTTQEEEEPPKPSIEEMEEAIAEAETRVGEALNEALAQSEERLAETLPEAITASIDAKLAAELPQAVDTAVEEAMERHQPAVQPSAPPEPEPEPETVETTLWINGERQSIGSWSTDP